MADEKKPVHVQLTAREEDWLREKSKKAQKTEDETIAKKVAARFKAAKEES